MLKTVKKVFLIFLFFLALVHPSGVLAACDSTQFDQSKAYTKTGLPSLYPYTMQCNNPDDCPHNSFCNSRTGWQCSITCWPKGATTKEPGCPPNAILYPACSNLWGIACGKQWCCTATTSWNPIDCRPGGPNEVPRNYCGTGGLWEYNDGSPDAVKRLGASTVGKCVRVQDSEWGGNYKTNCTKSDGTKVGGIDTAIGCVPTDDLTDFLKFVLKYAFFASGGIILLMVIATGYMLMTSQGNPEKLQAAKENIVALFSGLILIAFSLILLQVIGADILKLPTF